MYCLGEVKETAFFFSFSCRRRGGGGGVGCRVEPANYSGFRVEGFRVLGPDKAARRSYNRHSSAPTVDDRNP